MEKELYMPPCCIKKKLPPLMREHEGSMVQFYSQGDWGIGRLWEAACHLVSCTEVTADKTVRHVDGKVRMLLVLPNIDYNVLNVVSEYRAKHWADYITVIAHTTTLHPEKFAEMTREIKEQVTFRFGLRAASLSPLWLRYEDQSYNALLVTGPMFPTDKLNPTFATYSATFFDRKKDGTPNEHGRQLVEMTTAVWEEMTRLKI